MLSKLPLFEEEFCNTTANTTTLAFGGLNFRAREASSSRQQPCAKPAQSPWISQYLGFFFLYLTNISNHS